jgi:hypothetical protein
MKIHKLIDPEEPERNLTIKIDKNGMVKGIKEQKPREARVDKKH